MEIITKALEDHAKAVGQIADFTDELGMRVKDLEQATSVGFQGGGSFGGGSDTSLLSKFTDHDGFKAFQAGQAGSCKVALEGSSLLGFKSTTTGDSGSPASPDGVIVQAQRLNRIVPGTSRRLSILDAIPVLSCSSNLVEFTRESAMTNSAAAQEGEGSQFAESDILFELASAPVATIGTFLKVSKQALADQPQLMAFLDQRLRQAVRVATETAIISGDGVGYNPLGLTQTGQHVDYSLAVTGENELAALRRSKAQLENTDYSPSAYMLNPRDMAEIDLLTGNDGYLVGQPRAATANNLWQLPVVVSSGVTKGDFLCADLSNMILWDRQSADVSFYEQNSDDATRNLVTVVATIRVAFTVLRPAGIVYGQF
tara:strand:- start:62242 stop:63354 length:1113 start_codon:yes stop_codon:yes gene_type:complete